MRPSSAARCTPIQRRCCRRRPRWASSAAGIGSCWREISPARRTRPAGAGSARAVPTRRTAVPGSPRGWRRKRDTAFSATASGSWRRTPSPERRPHTRETGGPAARQVRLPFRAVQSACIGKSKGKPRHRRIRRDPAAIAAAGPLFAPG